MCLGIPGQITMILNQPDALAQVDVCGVKRQVSLACVLPDDGNLEDLIGCWTLVHVGFAMSLIDEAEAQKTLTVLAELSQLQDEMYALQASELSQTQDVE
ncbi:MAG: HypC/HybG/HupF family hydrogenase formation chaperone [Pontibacterium sp.]